MAGGTTLNILGSGFDMVPTNNLIKVGEFPCIVSRIVTEDAISCETTAAIGANLTNLTISITAPGKPSFTCGSPQCSFTYSSAITPLLRAVYPKAGVINDTIKFYGIHRIANLTDDVRGLMIGKSVCGRAHIREGPVDPNNYTYITCNVAPTMEAGLYNVSELLSVGAASKSPRLLTSGFINNNQLREFTVVPVISNVSAKGGPALGQTINITGLGFSWNTERLSVQVAGSPCKVQAASPTQITCVVQPSLPGSTFGRLTTNTAGTQLQGYIAGSGVQYTRYDINNLPFKSINGLRDAVIANSNRIKVLETGIKSELQTPDIYGTNYGQVFKGYFTAPAAGSYSFRAIVDDQLFFYLSSVSGSAEVNYSSPLMSSNTSSNNAWDMDYNFQNTSLVSQPVALQANEVRYFEVWHINTVGSGNFSVAVEMPNVNNQSGPNVRATNTLFFETIPSELLSNAATMPQVTLKVNNITAQCRTNCTYIVSNITTNPKIASVIFNRTSGLIHINMTNPSNTTFNISTDITVTVDGKVCRNLQGNDSQYLNCTPAKTEDGSLQMRAGNASIVVEIVGLGVIDVMTGFTPLTVNLTVPPVDQNNTVSITGGALIGIKGVGFPDNLWDTMLSNLSVIMCNANASVEGVNNTFLLIRAPACSPNTTNNNSASAASCIANCF